MSRFTLFVAVALSLTACGKKKQSAGSAEAIAKLTEFKGKACACKDTVCVSGVMVDFQKWSEAFNAGKKADDPMSADDEKQIDALNAATKVCVDKFDLTGSASAPPAAKNAPEPTTHGGGDHGEAQLQLNRIGKNAKVYYITNAAFMKGKSASLPAADCCKTSGKCAIETDAFAKDPVWQALDFQIDEPNQFHYTYESADGTSFHAEASGDPDCSGNTITYKLDGSSEAGNPKINLTGP